MTEEERKDFEEKAIALAESLFKLLPDKLPLQLERQYLELKEAMQENSDEIPGYNVIASMIAGYVVQTVACIKAEGQVSRHLVEIAMTAFVFGYNVKRMEQEIISSREKDAVEIKE